jgi:hypothetical protein
VADERRPLAAIDDAALETALRDLAPVLAYPADVDVAALVRQRIVAARPASQPGGILGWIGRRPVRRSLLVAVAALLILAAVAGAVGLGVPGIRVFFGGPTPPPATPAAPSATVPSARPAPSRPLGVQMGLGVRLPLDEVARLDGIDLLLPPDPSIGPPDASYTLGNRAALVWSARPGLPADPGTGVALLLSEFHGTVDQGYYAKAIGDGTTLTPVTVSGHPGYWISGTPHFFYYVDPTGNVVDDSHRVVGDTLIWSTGDTTYRLESMLPMDEAIRLAESLR